MWELVISAWKGWLEYTTKGKFAALLLAVLLFLWLRQKKEQKLLLFYTSLMAVLCIFPVSGGLLMLYQTKFYDYQWIWALVPVTLMIAFGATVFLTEYWENYGKKGRLDKAVVTLMVLAAILLCGSVGNSQWEEEAVLTKSERTAEILEELKTFGEGGEICLWAPEEIMEYARAVDGDVKLLYGRNMWDKGLNAYSYDSYGEEQVDCYLWMTAAEDNGELEAVLEQAVEEGKVEADGADMVQQAAEEGKSEADGTAVAQQAGGKRLLSGIDCARTAAGLGVNRILLPANMREEAVRQIETALGVQARELDGYYLFVLR